MLPIMPVKPSSRRGVIHHALYSANIQQISLVSSANTSILRNVESVNTTISTHNTEKLVCIEEQVTRIC